MIITLILTSDSDNNFLKDTVQFLSNKNIDTVYIKLGDREVGVSKQELLGAVKLLSE